MLAFVKESGVITNGDANGRHEEKQERRLVGKREVAEFLGVTRRTVELLQRQGLPFYKLTSHRNGYFIDEVKEWLTKTRRGA